MSEKGLEKAPTVSDVISSVELGERHGEISASELPRETVSDVATMPEGHDSEPRREAVRTRFEIQNNLSLNVDSRNEPVRTSKVDEMDEDELKEALEENGKHLTGRRKWQRILSLASISLFVIIGNLTPLIPVGLPGILFISLPGLINAVGIKKAIHDVRLAARQSQLGFENFLRGLSLQLFGDRVTDVLDDSLAASGKWVGARAKSIGKGIAAITFAKHWAPPVGKFVWNFLQKVFPDLETNGAPKREH